MQCKLLHRSIILSIKTVEPHGKHAIAEDALLNADIPAGTKDQVSKDAITGPVRTAHTPVPIRHMIMPVSVPIIVTIPNFFVFVRNSINVPPPISGTSTDKRGIKMGMYPNIATAMLFIYVLLQNG